MKKLILALGLVALLTGCGSTVQPTVGSGEVTDKTLNNNNVDFFTLVRVSNNYGTNIEASENSRIAR